MGTRSVIGIKTGPLYQTVYCHWDGYRDHNGRILVQFYNNLQTAQRLIDHGDISVLDDQIGERHDFRADELPGPWCTFYGRDRGDTDTEARWFSNLKDVAVAYSGCEFIYIFDAASLTWKCYNPATLRQLSLKKYQKVASDNQG